MLQLALCGDGSGCICTLYNYMCVCIQDWKKGYFRSSCNSAERVKLYQGIMIGILLCTYTQVGKTVSVILPTGVYSNT